jgi:L-fuconolactonase
VPEGPIVDSHVHLWDPDVFRMAWLDDDKLLGRPYGLRDYQEHTGGVDVEAMVYLEVDLAPHYALLEARWAADRAREDSRLQAIVAHAPVEFGEQARAYLEELVKLGPIVKGVRRITQSESDPAYCAQPRFVRGVQMLPEFGLSFDACIVHQQLPGLIGLVRQCPETSFVLDHLGKPNIAQREFEPWRSRIREMAALSNVVCKISGAVTEADHAAWRVEDLKPYVLHALEAFGEDRVLFGGDWPVVLKASSYRRWVDALDELTVGLSNAARKRLWTENARRVYRF